MTTTVVHRQISDRTYTILFLLISLVIFYPELFRQYGIPPRPLIVILLLFALTTVYESRFGLFPVGDRLNGFMLGIIVVVGGQAVAYLLGQDSPIATANYQRFLVTFPMALLTGGFIAGNTRALNVLSRIVPIVATGTGALAVVEYFYGSSLFGRVGAFSWLVRDGSARAFLASEHPLVLGSMLAIALPFAIAADWRLPVRAGSSAVIIWGIWSTGSRGALIIAVLLCITMVLPVILKFASRRPAIVTGLFGSALVVLGYYATFVWEPVTKSSDWAQNSLEYRSAIYSLLPDILAAAPFGYGLGDLPSNVWYVSAPSRYLDLTHSVDSQVVLSALRLGWPGVVAFLMAGVVAIYAISVRPEYGYAGVAAATSGFFVAVDAWDAFGVAWFLIVGCCIRLFVSSRSSRSITRRVRHTYHG